MNLLGGLTRPSLARRLVILASGGIVAALAIAAVVLALLFKQAALRRYDADLSDMKSVVIWCDRFNVAFGTAAIA